MSIAANIEKIKQELPAHVTLIAVSKTKPVEMLMEAYEAGMRHFGENKVQEMVAKQAAMPHDVCWHMLGHLQSNKVKYIAPFVHLIHSVDSLKLLEVINKEAAKNNRIIDCLLQFHIASEETKFGMNNEEAEALLTSDAYQNMQHIRLRGVMGMASFTDNETLIRQEFATLMNFFTYCKNRIPHSHFDIRSFGMSGDYKIAVDEGSTMVRIGSHIFGERSV
jgi:pyridoxal phosphate enzyme (YggS family)